MRYEPSECEWSAIKSMLQRMPRVDYCRVLNCMLLGLGALSFACLRP